MQIHSMDLSSSIINTYVVYTTSFMIIYLFLCVVNIAISGFVCAYVCVLYVIYVGK